MRSKVRYLLAGALVGAILICPTMAASVFPDVDEYVYYAEAVELCAGMIRAISTQIKP